MAALKHGASEGTSMGRGAVKEDSLEGVSGTCPCKICWAGVNREAQRGC